MKRFFSSLLIALVVSLALCGVVLIIMFAREGLIFLFK